MDNYLEPVQSTGVAVHHKKKNDLALSNIFIGSKYKASIQELKVTYLGLLKMQQGDYEKRPDGLYVTMKTAEIKKEFGKSGNGIYNQLVGVASRMTGRTIGYVNPEEQVFDYVSIISRAHYENGELTIRFTNEMEAFIFNLKKNFTYLPKEIMMKFKGEYSFKLYEILKSCCFYPKNYNGPRVGKFDFDISVAELRLMIGIVNSNSDKVKKFLEGNLPNYEKAVEKAPEKICEDWYEFRRKILEKAIKEINEKTDIFVTMDTISGGQGGKVQKVVFHITLKEVMKDVVEVITDSGDKIYVQSNRIDDPATVLSEDDKDDVIDQISELIEEKLRVRDYKAIAEAADFNFEKVENAYKIVKNTHKPIENLTGYLISAIKDNYGEPVVVKNVKKSKLDSYNSFPQNEYDYTQLEMELLSN